MHYATYISYFKKKKERNSIKFPASKQKTNKQTNKKTGVSHSTSTERNIGIDFESMSKITLKLLKKKIVTLKYSWKIYTTQYKQVCLIQQV